METQVAGIRPSTPVSDPLAAGWATPPTIAPSSPSGPRKRVRSPTKSPTFGQTKSPKKAPHDAKFKKARADKPKASCAQRMRFTIPPAKKDLVYEAIMNMIASYGERIWVHGFKEECVALLTSGGTCEVLPCATVPPPAPEKLLSWWSGPDGVEVV